MWKSLLILTFMPLILTLASATDKLSIADIPVAAQLAVERDYLEWMHLPRWAGDCVDMPVVKFILSEVEGSPGSSRKLWTVSVRCCG